MAVVPANGKRRPAVNLIDPALLDDVEKDALRARARATVDAEAKATTEEALYKQYLDEERRARDPKQETKYIVLDMAGHSDRIMLDGTVFFHGTRYAVSKMVYDSLRDIVARGWEHEDEVGGANRNAYKQKLAPRLNGRTRTVSYDRAAT